MKKTLLLPISFMVFLNACTTHYIADLTLPSPLVIHGSVTEIDDESFILKDKTGQIEVETDGIVIKDHIKIGDKVTVTGIVDEDDSFGKDDIVIEEFDAYSVTLENGKKITLIPH